MADFPTQTARPRRHARVPAVLLAVLATAALALPVARWRHSEGEPAAVRAILGFRAGERDAVDAGVAELGGQVLTEWPSLDALVVEVPAERSASLRTLSGVTAVTRNRTVTLDAIDYDDTPEPEVDGEGAGEDPATATAGGDQETTDPSGGPGGVETDAPQPADTTAGDGESAPEPAASGGGVVEDHAEAELEEQLANGSGVDDEVVDSLTIADAGEHPEGTWSEGGHDHDGTSSGSGGTVETEPGGVEPDATVVVADEQPGAPYWNTRLTRARSAWRHGVSGRGVDVALVDSGVTPVGGLDAGRVVQAVDFTEEAGTDRADLDSFGHGTHLASLIAGGRLGWNYIGQAPEARVISVKVADADGSTDLITVIEGILWVVDNAEAGDLNIRVLALALGLPDAPAYEEDPLAAAVQVAWDAGIAVVVSAGNEGELTAEITSPATNPYVIAVGGIDTMRTITGDDDVVAGFSSRGDDRRRPDVYAPARSLHGLVAPDSTIARDHPDAIDGKYIRGTGTSQAAAIVAGAAALLIGDRPDLSPDEVKSVLVAGQSTSNPTGQPGLNVIRSLWAEPGGPPQSFERPDLSWFSTVDGTISPDLSGNRWAGNRWAGNRWAGNRWASAVWTSGVWS